MRYRVVRARQRTITALDGAGDQGLWLVPNRRLGGGSPPPPPTAGNLTIGNSGTQWGYRVAAGIGAIAPDPYMAGTNGAIVDGLYADTASNNMRLTFASGCSPGLYTVVIDGQAPVYFHTGTGATVLTTSNAALVAYIAARGGQVLPFTLAFSEGLPPLVATCDGIGGTNGAGGNGIRGNNEFYGSWQAPVWVTAGLNNQTITGLYTDPAVANTCRLTFSNTLGGSPVYYMEFDGEAAVAWPALAGSNVSIVSVYLTGKLNGVGAGVPFQVKFYSTIA